MAKKGEVVGKMGDSVFYRTPDGQIIDDQGNAVKGPMAKTMAAEYEAKQQEKAKAQADAQAAAEEAKRQRAAEKSAEIARKASEKQAQQQERQAQQEARREEQAARQQEAQAASQARRDQAEANRQRTAALKQQNTQQNNARNNQQQNTAPKETSDTAKEPGLFKKAAMSIGQAGFNAAFPTFAGIINSNSPNPPAAAAGGVSGGSSSQALNRIADEVNTTNMTLQTSIARQETTNQLLGLILKEVQQIKKPSLAGNLLDAASSLLGLGGAGKAAAGAAAGAGAAGKVVPKSGLVGGMAGGALRRAPLIGALLGGGIDAYDEYQESGNATRAASVGVGGAAGGGLGAWGGATTGAALGAFGGPVGMAIGGLLGAAVGGIGGSYLGGKAGRAGYDALATPSTPAAGPMGPQASNDVKNAQATAKQESTQPVEIIKDSTVNLKTLTFNADNIVFNNKNQQASNSTNTPVTSAGPANAASKPAAATGPSSLPLPGGQSISGPTQSGSVREALASAQTPSAFGFGSTQIQAARAGGLASQSFAVTPGAPAPARVQPNQGAVQSASLGSSGTGGMSDASAVQLASTMVGKSRTQSLDYLRAGGYNNKGEAWCAEFVNSTLKQTGGTGSGSAVANSFQKWGTQVDPTKVQAGDVVLQTRGKGPGETGGHVGIATGVIQHGQVEMIAGNSGGQVKKYFVPVNGQLQVRRGSGGSGNNPKVAEATRDPSAGNAAGAARASNPSSSDASRSPGATGSAIAAGARKAAGEGPSDKPMAQSSAGAGRGSVVEGLNDRANAQQSAGAGRGSVVEGLNDRANAQMGAGAGRGSVVEGLNDRANALQGAGAGRGDGNIEMAARAASQQSAEGLKSPAVRVASNAEPQAAVSAKLTPKESGVMAGFGGFNPQLKGMMDGVLQGFLGRSRGSQLIQASMRDMMSDRSSRTGITVNQQPAIKTPSTYTDNDKHGSSHVGMVEPVDARHRLKELFGIG